MTNKTITLSRDLAERIEYLMRTADIDPPCIRELRAALAEPVPPGWPDPLESPQAEAIRAGHFDDTEFRALFDRMEQELKLHRALAASKTVPPAGGEPEVVYMLSNKSLGTAWRVADKEAYDSMAMVPVYDRRELVDRAYVTRLQAEVERLTTVLKDRSTHIAALDDENKALQAELAKARELLLPAAHRLSDLGQTHLSEPMFTFWLATDQSAPADEGDCAHSEANKHGCPECGEEFKCNEQVTTLARKYDDTLLPFVALMRKELHANADKGDRPGWLSMSADTCLLEIIYHFGKLQASVKRGDGDGMAEYGADVANMCMMLLDICGVINLVLQAEQPAPVAFATFKVISLPPSLTDHHDFDVLRDELAKVGVQVKEPKP